MTSGRKNRVHSSRHPWLPSRAICTIAACPAASRATRANDSASSQRSAYTIEFGGAARVLFLDARHPPAKSQAETDRSTRKERAWLPARARENGYPGTRDDISD
jgi:hypothetical protein